MSEAAQLKRFCPVKGIKKIEKKEKRKAKRGTPELQRRTRVALAAGLPAPASGAPSPSRNEKSSLWKLLCAFSFSSSFSFSSCEPSALVGGSGFF